MDEKIHYVLDLEESKMPNAEAELKMLLENPVIIYGAGRGAIRTIFDLKGLNANIIGLAVSNLSDDRTVGFDGYEVQTLDKYGNYKESAVVLIATSAQYHDEIKTNCLNLGFQKIILRSQELLEFTSIASHKKLFQKHNLSLTEDVIMVGNGKYLNPYSDIFPSKFGIVNQWADICSSEFGDLSLSVEGPYEHGNVKISPGDVVLDIGANVGYVSVYAASKGAEAYAFEPGIENQPMIIRHSELNGNKIHLEPFAVSDECGSAELWLNSNSIAAYSLDSYIGGGQSSVTVPKLTIDEFVRQRDLKRVDYIHANIMGFERQMLRGAQETLRKFAPKIAICAYQYQDDKKVLSDLILDANPKYKIEFLVGKLYAYNHIMEEYDYE